MSIDPDTLKQLTMSLAQYNSSVDRWVTLIAHGVQSIGLIILGIAFLLEWARLSHHFRDTQGTPLTTDAVTQITLKYFLSLIAVLLAPQIIDAILWICNAASHLIANTGGLSNQQDGNGANLFDMDRITNIHWYQKAVFSAIQFIYNFMSGALNIIVTILIFLRFITLSVFKALAPGILALGMTDDYKSVAINYWKQVAALSLQSVVLVITLKLIPFFVAGDIAGTGSLTWGQWTGAVSIGILKLVAVIIAIIASQKTARQMMGV